MLINDFHNRHGTHQEEERGAGLAKIALYGMGKFDMVNESADGEKYPTAYAHK